MQAVNRLGSCLVGHKIRYVHMTYISQPQIVAKLKWGKITQNLNRLLCGVHNRLRVIPVVQYLRYIIQTTLPWGYSRLTCSYSICIKLQCV
jgi:hypothetical protein